MNITDELREYTEKQIKWLDVSKVHYRKLFAIADRIDAEHEQAITSVMNDALYHANDKDMADLGWVRLPKDADGEYIRVGDWIEVDDGERARVDAITTNAVYWWRSDGCHWCQSFTVRHYHAPTVEDVLREFAYGLGVPVADSYVAATAAKLQLREDA